MTMRCHLMKTHSATCLLLISTTTTALACDKIDYVEVKDWPTAKVEQAYCEDTRVHFNRTVAQIEGKMGYDTRDAERCRDQIALYKRVLESRKRPVPSCK
jgi:hypothetical protein